MAVVIYLKRIFDIIKPGYIIPFASFVYFSHEENSYLNNSSIQISEFVDNFKNENIIVMKPNDEWCILDAWYKNKENIQFWSDQAKKINEKEHTKTNIFVYDDLLESFKEMKNKLCANS